MVCTHTGAPRRLRQKEHKFKASLLNLVRRLKRISKKRWAYSSEVELPPSIQEVLGSISSTTKERKEKEKRKDISPETGLPVFATLDLAKDLTHLSAQLRPVSLREGKGTGCSHPEALSISSFVDQAHTEEY